MDLYTYKKKKEELKEFLNIKKDEELIEFLFRVMELDPSALSLIFKKQVYADTSMKNIIGLKVLYNLLSHFLYPEKH